MLSIFCWIFIYIQSLKKYINLIISLFLKTEYKWIVENHILLRWTLGHYCSKFNAHWTGHAYFYNFWYHLPWKYIRHYNNVIESRHLNEPHDLTMQFNFNKPNNTSLKIQCCSASKATNKWSRKQQKYLCFNVYSIMIRVKQDYATLD